MRIPQLLFVLATALLTTAVSKAEERRYALHFKPEGHALGDVHPYFFGSECYLFSLKPGSYDSVLARSKDLLRWTETPITHSPVRDDDWVSPYFVLGVFRDERAGVFRSFFGHSQGRMASSVSSDLLHWSTGAKSMSVPPARYYERRRDPYVFWIPERGLYGCVMTTWMKGRPKESGGAISLATSPDLIQWEDHGPIISPGNIGEPECPQMFRLGPRWLLIASIYDRGVGGPVYWSAEAPTGPWTPEPQGQLDGKDLCAAQVAFEGDRVYLFGWIPLEPARPGQQHWGGHLALPRELYSLPDGKLATRLPAAIEAHLATLSWQDSPNSGTDGEGQSFEIDGTHAAIQFELQLNPAAAAAEIGVGPLGMISLSESALRIVHHQGEVWAEMPILLDANRGAAVRVVLDRDIIEVFVNDRYSLSARLPTSGGPSRLSFQPPKGSGAVRGLRVSELAGP